MKFSPSKKLISTVEKLCEEKLSINDTLKLLRTVSDSFKKAPLSTSSYVFRSEDLGVVVKRPALCYKNIPTSKYFIPTKVFKIKYKDRYQEDSGLFFPYWFIQPICNTSSSPKRYRAMCFLNDQKSLDKYFDLNGYNVGLYNGKPVFFDY